MEEKAQQAEKMYDRMVGTGSKQKTDKQVMREKASDAKREARQAGKEARRDEANRRGRRSGQAL